MEALYRISCKKSNSPNRLFNPAIKVKERNTETDYLFTCGRSGPHYLASGKQKCTLPSPMFHARLKRARESEYKKRPLPGDNPVQHIR